MRVANCKIVRREIEERDADQQLTVGAKEHVEVCAQCQAFYEERLKLRQLVAGLGTVEAPPDFDFRLRSRLASLKTDARPEFLFGRVALPSVVFAALLLVVGGVFALRVWNAPTNTTTAVNSETPNMNPQVSAPVDRVSSEKQKIESKSVEPQLANDGRRELTRESAKQKQVAVGTVASVKRSRPGTQEFSVTPATVVKRETIASLAPSAIFRIETSSQPMKVSLDYETGVSRTIFVPALSFGSQRVAEAGSTVKTSAKGVW